LCNVLAGEEKCVASASGESVTTDVHVLNVPFFGNSSLGYVNIVDTPGLKDTKGQAADEAQWGKVVEVLTTRIKQAHALVLVINGNVRVTEDILGAIRLLREAFGRDLWRALRIVVTRVGWDYHGREDAEDQAAGAERFRGLMLKVEEAVGGVLPPLPPVGLAALGEPPGPSVDAATRARIATLPVYGVDMRPEVVTASRRPRTLRTKRCGLLQDMSLGQLVTLDAQLREWCLNEGAASFDDCIDDNPSLEDLEEGRWFQWGSHFGGLSLGVLDSLRRDILATDEAVDLKPGQVGGDSRLIRLELKTHSDGLAMDEMRLKIFKGMQLKQAMDQSVYTNHFVKVLSQVEPPNGWIEDITLYSGNLELGTDNQLQHEVEDILNAPEDLAQSVLTARVRFRPGPPPQRLDPHLLKLCIARSDVLAALAMMRDGLTSAPQLAMMQDLEQALPRTKQHGAVFRDLLALREEERKSFRGTEEFTKQLKDQSEVRSEHLKQIQIAQQELKPWVEEVNGEAKDRAKVSEEGRQLAVQKTRAMLDAVKLDFLAVPAQIPDSASAPELVAFIQRLEQDFKAAGDNVERDPLGADELIWNSRVLKGMVLSPFNLQPTAQDMAQVREIPNVQSLLTPSEQRIEQYEEMYRSDTSAKYASAARAAGGESFCISASLSGAEMCNYGVGAFHAAAKTARGLEESKEEESQKSAQTSSYKVRRHHYYPQQLLQLDLRVLGLTGSVVQWIAQIIVQDERQWPKEIKQFFDVHGTHICPSVELGGVWTQEAVFYKAKVFDDQKVKRAMADCLDFDMHGGGGFFGGMGFGSVSSAASVSTCKASSAAETDELLDISTSTRISQACQSNLLQCPSSKENFGRAMTFNANWVAIDRKLPRCVPVWALVVRPHDMEEVVGAAAELAAVDRQATQHAVRRFAEKAEKVWHWTVLNLNWFCRTLEPSLANDTGASAKHSWAGDIWQRTSASSASCGSAWTRSAPGRSRSRKNARP